jgi:hypothetical protein
MKASIPMILFTLIPGSFGCSDVSPDAAELNFFPRICTFDPLWI